jgi:hypothetical protein
MKLPRQGTEIKKKASKPVKIKVMKKMGKTK